MKKQNFFLQKHEYKHVAYVYNKCQLCYNHWSALYLKKVKIIKRFILTFDIITQALFINYTYTEKYDENKREDEKDIFNNNKQTT